ncbi:conserved protein, unknown function [Hepatocystis sp. ex Piliocolobus tephrosceles]|nr:conserved protein, unknown function [Hepatocystis sp. ex Piliocolobus tephrosceles]
MDKMSKYDILPPPLEKITKPSKSIEQEKKNKNTTICSSTNSCIKKNTIQSEIRNEAHKSTKNDTRRDNNWNTFKNNMNREIKNKINNDNLLNKYKNVILDCNEISMIMNSNPTFKDMLNNKNITDFMNDYLTNPLEAIQKYKQDSGISNFLNLLFQYMNAKSNYTHLNNIHNTFTFDKK